MIREKIFRLVSSIDPVDDLELAHQQETLLWIESGNPLFRIQKPDIPKKHLVSYFILFDEDQQKVLLVDHKKACLWLPTGGHVEVDEDPKESVIRECFEELGIQADFFFSDPLFITSTVTVGLTAGHTDVSLWYILRGDSSMICEFDQDEFNTVQWFSFDEIPYEKSDPHMRRFIGKLKNLRSSL
ncbi:MAG: NUDIX domain-containing protein [Alphaproteobacteria bacterium]|nr:NUDIX domain-containing protein [Alphaproteobacteria bacterium]